MRRSKRYWEIIDRAKQIDRENKSAITTYRGRNATNRRDAGQPVIDRRHSSPGPESGGQSLGRCTKR